jgi:hypothetical protein
MFNMSHIGQIVQKGEKKEREKNDNFYSFLMIW